MNEAVSKTHASRIGRVGQILIAIGSAILILAGIAWVITQILEKQGISFWSLLIVNDIG